MKRFVCALFIYALLGVGGAYASAGGNYDKGLRLVRESKYSLALKEFLPLAENGHPQSQFSVGLIYHLGRGVKRNIKTAYEWYKKSAMQDHAPAMNNIGMMYLNGEYVVQNRSVAFRLFKKASASHSQAMDNLGQCYEHAWGTQRDIERAIQLYTQAGDRGYIAAWFHLGQLYERNYPGYSEDTEKAVKWYIKAAEKKQKSARLRLSRMGRLPVGLAQ